LATSDEIRSTISFGVPAGASSMDQVLTAKSTIPCSAKVGIPGAKPARLALAIPSGRMAPASNCDRSAELTSNIAPILPAMRSCRAG
jgi:hypothetical protein